MREMARKIIRGSAANLPATHTWCTIPLDLSAPPYLNALSLIRSSYAIAVYMVLTAFIKKRQCSCAYSLQTLIEANDQTNIRAEWQYSSLIPKISNVQHSKPVLPELVPDTRMNCIAEDKNREGKHRPIIPHSRPHGRHSINPDTVFSSLLFFRGHATPT